MFRAALTLNDSGRRMLEWFENKSQTWFDLKMFKLDLNSNNSSLI